MYPTTGDVEEEWNNIATAIKDGASEAVGKKIKRHKKKGLKIWNREIEEAIKEKQRLYKFWLQNQSDDNRLLYNRAKNYARTVIRQAQQISWENFITTVERRTYLADKSSLINF